MDRIIIFIEQYRNTDKYKVYLKENIKVCKDAGIEFQVIDYTSVYNHPSIDKDILIFKYGMNEQYAETLFIDADIKLISIPVFDKVGLPYFGSIAIDGKEKQSTCMVYVNNCMDIFKEYDEEYKRRGIQPVYNHYQKIIRDKQCYLIDKNCYEHDAISYKQMNQKKKEIPNEVNNIRQRR